MTVSLIRRLSRLLRSWKDRPRFGTPGLAFSVAVAIAAVLLVFLTGGPKASPTRPRLPQPESRLPGREQPAPAPTVELQPAQEPAAVPGSCPNGCAEPPPDCYIKGNISRKTGERIYHLPGGEFYDRTKISPGYGEAWFCTEEEARASGWRKSKR